MSKSVSEFADSYRKLGLTGSPFTAEQVTALENHLGLPLPAAYGAYLLIAGAKPPPALVGSDCHGDYLLKLRDWGDELLRECGRPFDLPADAVVFLMHKGYQFFYFQAQPDSQDPAVWYYYENWREPQRPYEHFSQWVADCTLASLA